MLMTANKKLQNHTESSSTMRISVEMKFQETNARHKVLRMNAIWSLDKNP